MAEVLRRPDLLRMLEGLDIRLAHAELVTGARRLGPVAPWRNLGDTGEPGFAGGWSNDASGTEAQPGFMLDERGVVWMRGHLGGTPTAMVFTTLPVGYRPPQKLRVSVIGQYYDTAFGVYGWAHYSVIVHTNGNLELDREGTNVFTDQDVWLESVKYPVV